MKVLFYLPSIRGYRDRVRTLLELSGLLDRLYLVVGSRDEELETGHFPNLRLMDAGFRPGCRLTNTWSLYRLCRRLADHEGIDILHDTFGALAPSFFHRSAFPGTRMVTSLYCLNAWRIAHVWGEVSLFTLLRNRNTALMFYGRLLERWTCERADGVILQAQGLIPRLQEDLRVDAAKIHILPNSVDTDLWSPRTPLLPPDGKETLRLISVGTLGRSRGVFTHLSTLKALLEKGYNVHLTLVGSMESADQVEIDRRIQEDGLAGRVALPGRLTEEEIRRELNRSHLFLYQTINDGSPRSLLEALAFGLPVIASRHPGIDSLDPEERAVRFTDFDHLSGILDRISELTSSPETWSEASRIGRNLAIHNNGIRPVAEAYRNLYHQLLTLKR